MVLTVASEIWIRSVAIFSEYSKASQKFSDQVPTLQLHFPRSESCEKALKEWILTLQFYLNLERHKSTI